MELSKQQERIVKTTASKVVVLAGAAAGKTRTMTERIRYLLDSGVSPEKIVAITFTNNAAAELIERLGEKAKGLHCQTIHSYANFLLRSCGIDTTSYIEAEDFDKFFQLVKQNPDCVQSVEHLLLDEAQDSTKQQFEFLLNLVQPKNWMFCGDFRQAIYGFKGASPEALINLTEREDVTTYALNENYRNGSEILDFARGIIRLNGSKYLDFSVPMRNTLGRVVEVEYDAYAIAKTIAKYQNFKDWFILVRRNVEMDDIISKLDYFKIPHDTFRKAQLTNAELHEKMQEDTVKVLTVHSAKGLEAKNVVVIGSRFYGEEEIRISYVAATRARDLLVWTRWPSKVKYHKTGKTSNWEN